MRQKEMLNKIGKINAQLAGDAAFVELGRAAAKVLVAPAKAQLPDGAKELLSGLKGHAAVLGGVMYVNENYDIPGLPAVEDALGAAFAADSVMALGDLIAKAVTRRKEVLGDSGSAEPPALPAANTAKGNEVKVASGLLKIIDKSNEIKRNTAQGAENVAEIDDEGKVYDVTGYSPMKLDDLRKTPENKYLCPDPFGYHKDPKDRARHKDKFQPWSSKNLHGYRSDLDGLMMCGGCRTALTDMYHTEKKATELAELADKKKSEAQAKIDTLTAEYDALGKKLDAYKSYEQEQIKAIAEAAKAKDDIANELGADNLASIQRKIKDAEAKMQEISDKVTALEAELTPATVVNTPPVVAANTTKGNENAKPTTNGKESALTRQQKKALAKQAKKK